jgi:hypothetical protein
MAVASTKPSLTSRFAKPPKDRVLGDGVAMCYSAIVIFNQKYDI